MATDLLFPRLAALGIKIRMRRNALGLSSSNLADRVGGSVTPVLIRKVEAGAPSALSEGFSVALLLRIAEALRCQPASLLTELAGDEGDPAYDLLLAFNALTPELRKAVVKIAETLANPTEAV